jgi:hypothetical protein
VSADTPSTTKEPSAAKRLKKKAAAVSNTIPNMAEAAVDKAARTLKGKASKMPARIASVNPSDAAKPAHSRPSEAASSFSVEMGSQPSHAPRSRKQRSDKGLKRPRKATAPQPTMAVPFEIDATADMSTSALALGHATAASKLSPPSLSDEQPDQAQSRDELTPSI